MWGTGALSLLSVGDRGDAAEELIEFIVSGEVGVPLLGRDGGGDVYVRRRPVDAATLGLDLGGLSVEDVEEVVVLHVAGA